MEKIKADFKIATKADVPKIIALCDECFEGKTPLEFALQSFERTEHDPNNVYLNGWVGGKLVAHTKITIIQTMYQPMCSYSIINHFCVAPKFRRHNIATQMMDVCIKISKQSGCRKVSLWSRNWRTDAHGFYGNYGFENIDAGFFEKKI